MTPERLVGGRYELEELVGAGGMSSVYKARDRLLERYVALKILHPHYSSDGEYVERFRREARAVAQLAHPNIVTVIDRGEDSGRQFIVFELVEGESLKDVVERTGPLPVEQAVEIALEIASALAFAHEHGIVHRDVKPQNVILNGDGRAKVTDFGIARSIDVDGVTQTGTVLGTSNYIAPEQASGTQVSPATDVYSLGIVLYELLTGSVPFEGDNFVQIAMRHVNETPPDVRERRPEVPPRLAAAVARALEKDPRERFRSMAEFGAELAASLADGTGANAVDADATMIVPARAVRRPARRRWWPLVVALLVCAALAAILYGLLANRGGGGGKTPAPGAQPIHLVGVGAFDPLPGDGSEHDSDAPLATDHNAATYWTTQLYHYGGGSLGKPGVGLVLDAGRPVRPQEIGIATDTPGFTMRIRAGASRTGPFHTVSPTRKVGSDVTFPIRAPQPLRYWVVWITNLGSYSAAHVNDVAVR